METLYVSLVGPLLGCYLQVDDAPSDIALRVALQHSRLACLWCAVYTRDNLPNEVELCGKPAVIIPCRYNNLPEDWLKFERHLAEATQYKRD